MKRLYLILFFWALAFTTYAQNEAGPDKVICKGGSVQIGGPDNGHCYVWDTAPGLTDKNKSDPTVSPTTTTKYKVTVIGQDFSFKRVDEVTVTVVENNAFPPANAKVVSGAAPSNPLGANDYGLTFPENVKVKISACSDGTKWHAILVDLTGNYSQQVRLLPGVKEVTGPAGNTTAGNFCVQVTDLKSLAHGPVNWYMLAAVRAHEDVHATRFKPSLGVVANQIENLIETITITDTGQSQQKAITEIMSSADLTIALIQAQTLWLAEILIEVANDHNPGGPTDIAEKGVVDPMATSICTHAKTKKWAACGACPP